MNGVELLKINEKVRKDCIKWLELRKEGRLTCPFCQDLEDFSDCYKHSWKCDKLFGFSKGTFGKIEIEPGIYYFDAGLSCPCGRIGFKGVKNHIIQLVYKTRI